MADIELRNMMGALKALNLKREQDFEKALVLIAGVTRLTPAGVERFILRFVADMITAKCSDEQVGAAYKVLDNVGDGADIFFEALPLDGKTLVKAKKQSEVDRSGVW